MGCRTPGENPDTFGERLERRRCTPGGSGQFVLADYQFDGAGSPGSADRFGWAVDQIADALVFDFSPSIDGTNPVVGPALALAGGTCDVGRATPWINRSVGAPVTSARYSATARHSTATILDPADNQDILAIAVVNPHFLNFHAWFGIYNGARGWYLATTNAGVAYLYCRGNAIQTSSIPAVASGGWIIIIADIDRDGTQDLYVGTELSDSDPCPVGSFAGAAGIGVNSSGNGGFAAAAGDVYRCAAWYGVGLRERIAAIGGVARIAASISGLTPRQGDAPTYARTGRRCYYPQGPLGPVHLIDRNTPPAGGESGLGPDEAIGALATGINVPLTAGVSPLWTVDVGITQSTTTHIAIASFQLNCPSIGSYVWYLNNPTGGVLYARIGAALGVMTPCWGSARGFVFAGTPRLGFHTAAGAFTPIADIIPLYYRTYGVATPAAVTDQLAIELPAGAGLTLILECADVGPVVQDEVAGTGPGATSTQGVVTTTIVQNPLLGTVEIDVSPQLWGTADPVSADVVCMDGALACFYTDGGGNAATADGVNIAAVAITEVDTELETWRHSHGDRGLFFAKDGTGEDLDVYDGDMSGALSILGTRRRILGFRVLRNSRWYYVA